MTRPRNVRAERPLSGELRALRGKLLSWWRRNGRAYPWRRTRNPYRVLVAEVLLHRTKADQVVPMYRDLVRTHPSVESLAKASTTELEKLLHSAGLRWRIGLLRTMAKQIVSRYSGRVPREAVELRALAGVGPYIAGAVRSFAFGQAEAVIDTNTVRIVGRLWNLRVTDSSRRSAHFRQLHELLLDRHHSMEFNLALLDLGATTCRPGRPLCPRCPIAKFCCYGRARERAA